MPLPQNDEQLDQPLHGPYAHGGGSDTAGVGAIERLQNAVGGGEFTVRSLHEEQLVGQASRMAAAETPAHPEHADGERRCPVPIGRYLKTRLTETFPALPSDLIWPSAFAVGMRRKVVQKFSAIPIRACMRACVCIRAPVRTYMRERREVWCLCTA